jgi:hypothetical protein
LGPLGVLLCGDAKKIDAIFYMAKFLKKKNRSAPHRTFAVASSGPILHQHDGIQLKYHKTGTGVKH